jgi:hypothetical protein
LPDSRNYASAASIRRVGALDGQYRQVVAAGFAGLERIEILEAALNDRRGRLAAVLVEDACQAVFAVFLIVSIRGFDQAIRVEYENVALGHFEPVGFAGSRRVASDGKADWGVRRIERPYPAG